MNKIIENMYRNERNTDVFIGVAKILIDLVIFAVVLFLATSCAHQKVTERIVTITKEIVRLDTAIVTKPDSASAVALLHCDSAYNVVLDELEYVNGEKIRLEGKMIEAGKLKIDAEKIQDTIYIEKVDTFYLKDTTETVVEVVKEKGFFYYMGVLFVIILIIALIGFLLKLSFRL